MRRLPFNMLLALAVGALLVSGCGSDGDDGDGVGAVDTTAITSPNDDTDDTDDTDGADDEASGAPEPEAGLAGSATVGGTTYDLDQVISCDPKDPNQVDGMLLDLTGIGSADGAQINVFLTEFSGSPIQSVDWSGPEGIFSGAAMRQADGQWVTEDGTALSGAPFQVGVSSVQGAMPMTSEEGDSLDLEFELPLPNEFSQCF